MNSFFSALTNPALPFLQNALMASLLASILFGILGSVVTVKRIAGLAGAISHAVLGGIGMALYLSSTRLVSFITPMAGAIIFAVLSAFIIGLVSLKAKQREDTVINAIWAIGMSLGVLFLSKTPGYTDPTSYLFGNILLVSRSDLFLLAALDAIVLLLVWRFYPQIEASAFDEEFARVRGIPTDTVFLVILGITAIAVVLLQTFVGLVMVIAMLTLPAGTAGYLARNLAGMMVFSWIFSSIFSFAGLALSWHYDLPSGAVVVVLSGAMFLSATAVRMLIVRIKRRRGYAS
ncbi:metal ABC transporter permease [Gracilinema caldarium]|uniref:metal ABC transporter permease n=1 Tax=Gracilinema caldarium TaxID=215591 RepID=UPI0026EDAA24|nr:metal ABC transporter permease [Gracilinema caldarium]